MYIKSFGIGLFCASAVLVGCDKPKPAPTDTEKSDTTTKTTTTSTSSTANTPTDGKNYIVVSQSSYPPFASLDEKGNVIGMDIDILKAIGEKEGMSFTFLPHDMTGLLETLNTGKADLVATGVNITPERQMRYDFSEPYIEGSWVVLMDKTKSDVASFDALKDKPIAAQQDSLAETQLKATNITTNIMPVKTVFLGINATHTGKAVGVYDVDTVLNTYIKPGSSYYTVVDAKSGKIPFGYVMKKGNTELKTKIDKGLAKIKQDGTYQKILDKWYPITSKTTVTVSATTMTTSATSASQ